MSEEKISRNLILSGEVDEISVTPIIKAIQEINAIDDENEDKYKNYVRNPIILTLNTPGGSVYDGFALVGAIELSVTPIITIALGSCMSIGLAILNAGHERYTHRFTLFLYHSVAGGFLGKLNEHITNAENLIKIQNIYDKFILEKSTFTKELLDDYKEKNKDFYFDAETAIKYGIVDGLIEVTEIKAENGVQ